MNKDSKAWTKALKVLPYTILIKAVSEAVMLICVTAVGFCALKNGLAGIPAKYVLANIAVLAQAAVFISCIICISCLGAMISLTDSFSAARRALVSVLILDCIVVMLTLGDMAINGSMNGPSFSAYGWLFRSVVAADKLLKGCSIMLLMRAYSEVLQKDGNQDLSRLASRLGKAYLCIAVIGTVFIAFASIAEPARVAIILTVAAASAKAIAIAIEFVMVRITYSAGFQIWRKRVNSLQEAADQ